MSDLGVALLRPAAVLAFAAVVPFVTVRVLERVLLRGAPAEGEARARALLPFRSAAFVVGFAQIQVSWVAGFYALAPPLVSRQGGVAASAFGAAAALVAFLAGGVARRVEEPPAERSTVRGVIALRLRLATWFSGPIGAGALASALPVANADGVIAWGWVALALVACVLGVAYGGLLVAFVLRALVPAPPAVTALARDAAARENTWLGPVLRLPTRGARFANAAAIPWARTMVVTDGIVALLTPDELRAVLAHEAGHLSEPPSVMAARLGSATLMMFSLTTGTRLAAASGLDATVAVFAGVAAALVLLLVVRRLARRMETRADAHARATVGAEPLAAALVKLHTFAQMPLVTGARRVHPDLYDRLTALGVDAGPRPPAPRGRRGLFVGLAVALTLAGLGFLVLDASTDSAAAAVNRGVVLSSEGRHAEAAEEYRRAIALDPEDGIAHYDLAIALDRLGERGSALAAARTAARLRPSARVFRLLARVARAAGETAEADEAERLRTELGVEDDG